MRNSRQQGARLFQGLNEIQERRASVGDVRGLGLMCGVEFVKNKAVREPFPPELKTAERVMDACMERGLIVFPGHGTIDGTAGDHLLIGPPLVIAPNQVDDLLTILDEAVGAVEKEIRP